MGRVPLIEPQGRRPFNAPLRLSAPYYSAAYPRTRIARRISHKIIGRGVDYDDLKQVASLALLRGIDRFNPDLNMQFTTFITPTIAGEIKNYFRDKARMVKLPRKLSEIHAKVRAFCADSGFLSLI